MTLVKWTPKRRFVTPFDEIEKLFNRVFPSRDIISPFRFNTDWTPAVDVVEGEKEYTLRVETPGMTKKDINITVQDGILSISGEKKQDYEDKGDNYYCNEAYYGSFSRSFRLQENVDEKKIKANYKNGVLHLTIPKTEPVEPNKFQVSIN